MAPHVFTSQKWQFGQVADCLEITRRQSPLGHYAVVIGHRIVRVSDQPSQLLVLQFDQRLARPPLRPLPAVEKGFERPPEALPVNLQSIGIQRELLKVTRAPLICAFKQLVHCGAVSSF